MDKVLFRQIPTNAKLPHSGMKSVHCMKALGQGAERLKPSQPRDSEEKEHLLLCTKAQPTK